MYDSTDNIIELKIMNMRMDFFLHYPRDFQHLDVHFNHIGCERLLWEQVPFLIIFH